MASDVEVVVGAKDQATKILDGVGKQTKQLTSRVKRMSRESVSSTKKMKVGFQGLKAATGPLLAAFAAFKGATAAFRVIGDSAEAFDKQKESVRGLTQAIKLSGDATGPSMEQHKAFASQLQNLANVGDEVTLGLMKQASMLGASNSELQSTTKAAIGLAEATGQNLETSMRRVMEAQNGSFSSLQRYIPALRDASTEQEKMAIISETAGKGLQQQAERARTAEGAGQRLSNSWGDFLEVIGKALAPVRQFISAGLATLVETIQASVIPAIERFTPAGETIKTAMETARAAIIKGVTAAEVYFGSGEEIMRAFQLSAKLQFTKLTETVRHALTVQIPAYAKWFGENWSNLVTDAFNASVTIVQNRIKKIGDIITRLWEFVRSGFEGGASKLFSDVGDIAARSMLDGFEARTQSLPEIAARQMTAGERQMTQELNQLAGNAIGEYQRKVKERMAGAGKEGGKSFSDGLALNLKAGTEKATEDIKKTVAEAETITKKAESQTSSLQANQSRLLSRRTSQDPAESVAKNTEAMKKQLGTLPERIAAAMPDFRTGEGVTFVGVT